MVATSSVAKAWPSNWFVAIDWLLQVFRSLLPATFLKAFSYTCGAAVTTGRGENQLDENGNPLPIEETTGPKVEDATSDVVQSRAAFRVVEYQLPENYVHLGDGKASKGGKEFGRRGAKAQGKAQMKQKSLKSKKNEIGAKATKIVDQGSSGELGHHGTSAEVKNEKHDNKSRMKSTEEECVGEEDEEQQIISLSETGSMEDDCKDEFNETENASSVNADASLVCSSGEQDLDVRDENFVAESCEKFPEERPTFSRSQSRKKRRKGKPSRSQNSKVPDSASVGAKISPATEATINTNDTVIDSSSNVLPIAVGSPTNVVKSVPFCCHQLSNVRQKPSARVPPSRLNSVDNGLNSRVISCVMGEKSYGDLGEKTVNGLSIVDDNRIDEEKFVNVEGEEEEVVKALQSSVEMTSDSNNAFIVDRRSNPNLETSEHFKNDVGQISATEVVDEVILPKVQPCMTVPASPSVCPLSPSRKQSTLIGQQGRVKPQSTVNPFSVLDSSISVRPLHTNNQTLHPTPQTRIRIEPPAGAKPKFNQSPRLKPRSLVNPVNPLRVDQSMQTRVRLHPRFDPVHSSTDFPKPTPNDVPEMRTAAAASDPNPTFRILRRRPGMSTSLPKHSDSSETKHSVVTTEQCSSSCYDKGCHGSSNPSVAKTTVCSESSHHDNVMTAPPKRGDVAKRPLNSRLSDRKSFDHNSIVESIRTATPATAAESHAGERVERESGARVGSSTSDRFTASGSRTSPKNTRTTGPRTSSCFSQVAENAATFDLVRAQQYLRSEFLRTMELKKRGGNVKFLKL